MIALPPQNTLAPGAAFPKDNYASQRLSFGGRLLLFVTVLWFSRGNLFSSRHAEGGTCPISTFPRRDRTIHRAQANHPQQHNPAPGPPSQQPTRDSHQATKQPAKSTVQSLARHTKKGSQSSRTGGSRVDWTHHSRDTHTRKVQKEVPAVVLIDCSGGRTAAAAHNACQSCCDNISIVGLLLRCGGTRCGEWGAWRRRSQGRGGAAEESRARWQWAGAVRAHGRQLVSMGREQRGEYQTVLGGASQRVLALSPARNDRINIRRWVSLCTVLWASSIETKIVQI
jgi:hypothetical protein